MASTSATSCREGHPAETPSSSNKRIRSRTTSESSLTNGGSSKVCDSAVMCRPRKRMNLRIDTSVTNDIKRCSTPSTENSLSCSSDIDSLFDEFDSDDASTERTAIHIPDPRHDHSALVPALLTGPPIKGLFFPSTLRIPDEIADVVLRYCMGAYFSQPHVNQVMLFGRAPSASSLAPSSVPGGIPAVLLSLLSTLSDILLPVLPPDTHALLFPEFPTKARQAIVNLYQPGEGITAHVDLLQRYGDGIVGVSLGSGCAMRFCRVPNEVSGMRAAGDDEKDAWEVFLGRNSVIVLSEAARYDWTHEIERRTEDYVSCDDASLGSRWIKRGVRLSVTFRWLLPGADVVGTEDV